MNVAVVGSRTFDDYQILKQVLDELKISKIISGGARGADLLAEKYAKEFKLETKIFLLNWKKFGRGAGVIRNKDIVYYSNFVVAFWDGK